MDLVDGEPVVVASPVGKHSHDSPAVSQPIATPVRNEHTAPTGHQESEGQERPGMPSDSQFPATQVIPESAPSEKALDAEGSIAAVPDSSRKARPSCMQPLYDLKII